MVATNLPRSMRERLHQWDITVNFQGAEHGHGEVYVFKSCITSREQDIHSMGVDLHIRSLEGG